MPRYAIARWDKRRPLTGDTLSSKRQYFLRAMASRQLSVLCGALSCEAVFVACSILFSHMVMGRFLKPGAGLSSPAKESGFAFMFLMERFIMSSHPRTEQTLCFKESPKKKSVLFWGLLKHVFPRHTLGKTTRGSSSRNTAAHYSCISRVATAYTVRVWWITEPTAGSRRSISGQLRGNHFLQKASQTEHLENARGPAQRLLSWRARSAALSSLCNPRPASSHCKEQFQGDPFQCITVSSISELF